MVGRTPSSRKRVGSAVRAPKPSALRPGARPGGGVRRTKPVKRASAYDAEDLEIPSFLRRK